MTTIKPSVGLLIIFSVSLLYFKGVNAQGKKSSGNATGIIQ